MLNNLRVELNDFSHLPTPEDESNQWYLDCCVRLGYLWCWLTMVVAVVPQFMLQGGDFTHASGIGGESIYGAKFAVRSRLCKKRT